MEASKIEWTNLQKIPRACRNRESILVNSTLGKNNRADLDYAWLSAEMLSMDHKTMEHTARRNRSVAPDLDGAAYGTTSENARADLKEVAA
jgi:hypothetical protein